MSEAWSESACRQLDAEEEKDFVQVPVGMMLEVPAAAVSIDTMLKMVDFVSIGSNDLVQYLMAADRDNPKVSHLCQPLSPPVLRMLTAVIEACRQAKCRSRCAVKWPGNPAAFVLLLGMGLRSFSMSPAFVPSIKELATQLTVAPSRVDSQASTQAENDVPRQTVHVRPDEETGSRTCRYSDVR